MPHAFARRAHQQPSTPGNGPKDDKGLRPGCDRIGQWVVRGLMGQILLAGEEPQKRPALVRDVIADGAAQHGIAGLKRIEHRALRDRTRDVELDFAANVRQCP